MIKLTAFKLLNKKKPLSNLYKKSRLLNFKDNTFPRKKEKQN